MLRMLGIVDLNVFYVYRLIVVILNVLIVSYCESECRPIVGIVIENLAVYI